MRRSLVSVFLPAALVAACSEAGPKQSQAGPWSSLTAFGASTCGLTTGGSAYCWGDDSAGGLGDGSTTSRPLPTPVSGGIRFARLYHSCGLTSGGSAYCWGDNYYGELGDGTTTDRLTPAAVAGGLSFASLAKGGNHTCGLTTTGTAYCWGLNYYGELGDGSGTDSHTPVPVTGQLSFASLAAGGFHTCGVTAAGVAYCWGSNEFMQLGNGSTTPYPSAVPVAVMGGLRFTSLTAGSAYTCGLIVGGAAYCWGLNTYGQLGDGSTDSSTGNVRRAPVAVVGDLRFAVLDAGSSHTCGVTTGGAAYCWGINIRAQLGDGTINISKTAPVTVAGTLTFTSLAAGAFHTCGVTTGGDAYCWGENLAGELGDGSGSSYSTVPVAVANPE